jgi:glycerophosphoryl diester phosphodiesterase
MAQQGLFLTNYTYSDNSTVIGRITSKNPAGTFSSLKLVGPTGSIFMITKENELHIRKLRKQTDLPYQDVVIEYKTAAGKFTDTLRIVNDRFIRNKVIAHRGAWKKSGTTENSIVALQNAIHLGCMGSEFDVHMSADSVLFVNHDHTLGGVAIEKTPAAELAQLKLSNGESLPTVEAYLMEGMKQNKTKLILEIKPSQLGKERSIALAAKVVQLVENLKAQGWVDYISFEYDICKTVIALAPYARVAYLNGDKTPEQLAADKLFGLDYHYNILKKNEHWLQEAKQHHITVNVWTVNDRDTMQWFLDRKVDFITTNEPELLLELIK